MASAGPLDLGSSRGTQGTSPQEYYCPPTCPPPHSNDPFMISASVAGRRVGSGLGRPSWFGRFLGLHRRSTYFLQDAASWIQPGFGNRSLAPSSTSTT